LPTGQRPGGNGKYSQVRAICDLDPECRVDLGLVLRIGLCEHLSHIAEPLDHRPQGPS